MKRILTFGFSLADRRSRWLSQPWFYTGLACRSPRRRGTDAVHADRAGVHLLPAAIAAWGSRRYEYEATASPPNRPMPMNGQRAGQALPKNASTLTLTCCTRPYDHDSPAALASRIWRQTDAARKEEHARVIRLISDGRCPFRFHPGRDAAGRRRQRQKLYDASCTSCHNDSVHKRKDHKVKSLRD